MAVRGLDRGQRPALVVSEVQNGITNAAYEQSPLIEQVTERGIVPRIDALAGAFRAAGLPVVHVTIAAPRGMSGFRVNCALAARIAKAGKLVTGTPYAAVHADLPVHESDRVMERMHGMAPFTGTELDAVLRGHGVDTVVLAGVSANIALPGASTEAVALGYEVVLVEDCAAGGTAESHAAQIANHLPLLATISDNAAVTAALGG